LRLQAEDEIATAMDAYVHKQSMNYMAAGLRSIANAGAQRDKARRERDADEWFATRAKAVFNQPRTISAIGSTDDNLPSGLARRAQELTNRPSGSVTANHGRVAQPGLVNRDRVVQARAFADDEDEAAQNGGYAQQSEYEQHRQYQIYQNNLTMYQLGLRAEAPVDPRGGGT